MNDNRYQDLFDHLKWTDKENNVKRFDVFSPGQHNGDCRSWYIVIKGGGSSGLLGISSNEDYYEITVHVPKNNYSQLESKIQEVKRAMSEDVVKNMFKETGEQSVDFYDDQIKAHTRSIVYKNYKKRYK